LASAKVGYPTSGTTISLAALYERCDSQGRFEWDGAAFGAPVRLQAEAPGYDSVERTDLVVTDEAPTLTVVFRLAPKDRKDPKPVAGAKPSASQPAGSAPVVDEPRRAIRGVVYASDGKPAGDAQVRWGATDYEATKRSVRADAQGRFVLEQVPDRKGYVTVFAAGQAPSFEPVPAGNCEIEVRLEQVFEHLDVTPRGRAEGGGEDADLDPNEDPEIQDLLAKGNALQATKRYQELTGVSPEQAKQAIDRAQADG
jgi:hypothetical protein